MKKTVNDTQLVENVMINGQEVPLGRTMTVAEAKAEVESSGILTNIGNATPVMVNDTTVDFVNQRGENGL